MRVQGSMSLADDNYNPFQKVRRLRTVVYEEDDSKLFEDPRNEPVFSQFLRRATRRITFNPIFHKSHPSSLPRVEPIVSNGSKIDEENISTPEPDSLVLTEDRDESFSQRIHHNWRQVRTKFGFYENRDVKPAIAKIAQLTLANAPLGTKGKVLLEAFARPNRRSRALVVEYQIRNPSTDGKSCNERHVSKNSRIARNPNQQVWNVGLPKFSRTSK